MTARSPSAPARRRARACGTVYAWELRKLRAQKRTYIGLGCAVLVPLIFIVALLADDGGPEDIPFGRYVRESGLAIPLVGLFFGSIWFFPLITALVAGDIVATEDGNGTLKTILTRSVDRWQIFVGQGARRAHLRVRGAAALRRRRAGARRADLGLRPADLAVGHADLGRARAAAARRDRARLLPADDRGRVARAPALHASRATRAAAVVGDADDLADHAAARDHLGARLPAARTCSPTQFNAWQGLLREPIDWAPIVRAAWVCALFALPALAVGVHALHAPGRRRRLSSHRGLPGHVHPSRDDRRRAVGRLRRRRARSATSPRLASSARRRVRAPARAQPRADRDRLARRQRLRRRTQRDARAALARARRELDHHRALQGRSQRTRSGNWRIAEDARACAPASTATSGGSGSGLGGEDRVRRALDGGSAAQAPAGAAWNCWTRLLSESPTVTTPWQSTDDAGGLDELARRRSRARRSAVSGAPSGANAATRSLPRSATQTLPARVDRDLRRGAQLAGPDPSGRSPPRSPPAAVETVIRLVAASAP